MVLEFHFDQLKVIAKDNYDIDMKIKHEMVAIYLHKQRVRKNMTIFFVNYIINKDGIYQLSFLPWQIQTNYI